MQINPTETSLLAKNFIKSIKNFEKGCPGIINDNNIKLELLPVLDSAIPTSIGNSEDQPKKRNFKILTNTRLKNRNRSVIWQLNITSIRNNFEFLCSKISQNLDLLLVSKTKLDDSFATPHFLMSDFCKSYRLDRYSNGWGLLLYIKEDIPFHLLSECKPPENVECFVVEINIRKKKWLLCCSCNAHKNNMSSHIHHLNKVLDVYLKQYDKLLISGDLTQN